ncbi:MAG: ATP-dependent DNA helicase RecG [Emergencia sp.]
MQLSDRIGSLRGIGPKKAEAFSRHQIETLEDLLYFFPRRYEDRRHTTPVGSLQPGKDALVTATVLSRRYSGNPYRKNTPLTLLADDGTGRIEIVFFNGRYIANLFNVGQEYTFYGKVTASFERLQMIHPEFHKKGDPADVRGIIPVYPAIEGISQNELRKLQLQLRPLHEELKEWLPAELTARYRLASPSYAISNIHFPGDERQVLESRFRLVFEELLTLETGLFHIKNDTRKDMGGIDIDCSPGEEFISGLPFAFTEGQRQAWEDIKKDMHSEKVMNRLIQGDVGSGKTAVAEAAMFAAAKNGYQSIMMAPTELLARQHMETLSEDFAPYGLKTAILCSSMKAAEKKAVLQELESGEIQILVGTHAVIQPDVKFRNPGIVITDEQHRFGVSQRSLLSRKGANPNVLVMTATPIPRTLAVILYGDLDISQIRTMPAGRRPVLTSRTDSEGRRKVYDFVEKQLAEKKQAYVVAPLIEESDKVDARSAEALYVELKERFADYRVAMVHGAMKQEEKDSVMAGFAGGRIDVLVSTVVIEVGINVPNATVMVIENAERFGLAQLHQLRGRVGRGGDQSYCFLICTSDSQVASERCDIMCSTADGFEIAEADLRLRGPGELFGTRQHGLPELHISDLIRHGDVLEKAKDAAKEIIDKDPQLLEEEIQPLKKRIQKMFGENIRMEL